ncbi:MAG: hypothetical protein Q8P18_14615 [Pseudomonadota bacterium]|nr:hypothetical protein [Pseudomonadota bacterium]
MVGEARLTTRFAVPSGPVDRVLEALDETGLGLARARIAARLGDPDPFHVRAALAAAGATVAGTTGLALTSDAADAALLAADVARGGPPDPALAGLFAGRPPGPCARAVPVDDPRLSWLRWQFRPTRPARVGAVSSWSAAEIGDTDVATVRCVLALPGGGVALGSDYGLTLWKNGAFTPFPWPLGSRREARRVESMAVNRGHLYVATSQALYVWDFAAKVTSRRHGADEEDGFDDLNVLLSTGERLYLGYRTRFEGGVGPPDTLAMAADPAGVVYAGTRDGELHVISDAPDGGGPIRSFADHKPRPVRHLAWAEGSLWVAALGTLHRFDGASWSAAGPEPTALAVDSEGRLWALAEGRLHVLTHGTLVPVTVPLERPWSLTAVPGALWIGGRERVWRVEI